MKIQKRTKNKTRKREKGGAKAALYECYNGKKIENKQDQLNKYLYEKGAMIRNLFGILICRKYCSYASADMVKVLNVAEKNDAAKTIANVMSRGSARKVLLSKRMISKKWFDNCPFRA